MLIALLTLSSDWLMKTVTLKIIYNSKNEYEIDLFGETLRFTEKRHLCLGNLYIFKSYCYHTWYIAL